MTSNGIAHESVHCSGECGNRVLVRGVRGLGAARFRRARYEDGHQCTSRRCPYQSPSGSFASPVPSSLRNPPPVQKEKPNSRRAESAINSAGLEPPPQQQLAAAITSHIPYRIFSSPLARSAITTPSAGNDTFSNPAEERFPSMRKPSFRGRLSFALAALSRLS